MAGQDQSKNLSGMLSSIGTSLGSMGGAAEGLLRPIENTFRPQADPEDLGSMQNLMQWQQKMGREDAARTTMVGIQDLQKKQKEERTKREGQARALAVSQFEKALQSGDEQSIAAAEDALRKVGEVQGIDVTSLLAGVEQRTFAQSNQAHAESERLRLAQERAKDAQEELVLNKLATQMNSATSIEELDSLLKSASPEVAGVANSLYNNASNRIDKAQERAEAEAAMNAPMQPLDMSLPSEAVGSEVADLFNKRGEQLNDDIEKFNKAIESGNAMLVKTTRSQLQSRRNALESQAHQATYSALISEHTENKKDVRQKEADIRTLELGKRAPYKDDAEIMRVAKIIAGVDEKTGGYNPVTTEIYDNAKRQLIRQRNADIDNQIRFLRGEENEELPESESLEGESGPEVGKVYDGMRFLGGNPNDPDNWERPSREWDRNRVQTIRSKISPLGTYTQ